MGLDTTHNCWHGPYHSFGIFRKELAKQIGIDLTGYEGFGGTLLFEPLKHEIKPLLDHSDCSGNITPEDAKSIVIGLNLIISNMDKEPYEGFKFHCERFRDGCIEAIEANEDIEFH